MESNNTFIGTPNGKFQESHELYNLKTSLVLKHVFNNHFVILAVCENPIEAIEKRNNIVKENETFENSIKVHWN